ncbi:MAG: hypothetical protein JWN51_3506 [Phycisphaerales bacterium]|nr:hypothetical protein [Phycisphaerales bacterium]
MNIFAEIEASEFVNARLQQIKREVSAEDQNKLLNINETEYINYLVAKYRVDPLVFDYAEMAAGEHEESVRVERMRDFDFRGFERGQTIKRQIITFYIPFVGERDLLKCAPGHRRMWTMEVEVKGETITFTIPNYRDDSVEIKRELDNCIEQMQFNAQSLANELNAFNQNVLPQQVAQEVKSRRAELLRRTNTLQSLGVKLRPAGNVPATFSVPITPKPLVVKPSAPSTAYKPEPTIDEATYRGILTVLHDLGVSMERMPSIYAGRGEEALRDLLIMQLAPHFQSVTGETFNRVGKTDILVREDGKTLFVAECKFWKGLKGYHTTIDQALSYLTWRDSKAAVLCFVKGKNLQPVLDEVRDKTKDHAAHVAPRGNPNPGWFDFEFHLPNDNTRRVMLAVLCFHFPPVGDDEPPEAN